MNRRLNIFVRVRGADEAPTRPDRHHGRRRLIVGGIGAVAMLVAALAGWAFWTTSGSGSASASIGTLATPAPVSASSPSTGVARVSWAIVAAPSGSSTDVTYIVERS